MWTRQFFLLGDGQDGGFTPRVEALVKGDQYLLRAELPGVDPAAVEIVAEDGILTLRGERRHEARDEGATWFRREARYGGFERRFELPEGTDPDAIRAAWRNGVLEVSFPAPAAARRRVIRIPVVTASETTQEAAA